MIIRAADVGVFEDYDDEQTVEVAVRGLDENGSHRSLSFQRSTYPPDQQEISAGMDSYNVSDQAGVTVYGCLRNVRISGNVIDLRFATDDAAIFGIPEDVTIELPTSDFNIEKFYRFLLEVLDWGSLARRPQILRV